MNQKEKLTFEGRPEGYAVDANRGRLYMNYEGKDLTTAIGLVVDIAFMGSALPATWPGASHSEPRPSRPVLFLREGEAGDGFHDISQEASAQGSLLIESF